MPLHLSAEKVQALPDFLDQSPPIEPGQYAFRYEEEKKLSGETDKIETKIWFQSPVRYLLYCVVCSLR